MAEDRDSRVTKGREAGRPAPLSGLESGSIHDEDDDMDMERPKVGSHVTVLSVVSRRLLRSLLPDFFCAVTEGLAAATTAIRCKDVWRLVWLADPRGKQQQCGGTGESPCGWTCAACCPRICV